MKQILEAHHGQVKNWKPRVDPVTKIKTGEYIFVMDAEELRQRPIPRIMKLNNRTIRVHYRTQPVMCFSCGEEGHKSRDCPTFPPLVRRDSYVHNEESQNSPTGDTQQSETPPEPFYNLH